jgi:hypothetical protein
VAFRGFGIVDVPANLPTSAFDWFMLLQDDRLLGLALFDLVDLVNYGLVGPIFLALCVALWRANQSAMALAAALSFVGIAIYFASNQAFSMLALSDQHAAATTETQRAMFLAVGEALLAIHNPGAILQGTGIHTSLLLVLLAGLIISIVMLRSPVVSRATAYVGLLANGFGLGSFVTLAFAPALAALPHVIAGPFRMIWYILIAVALFRLGSGRTSEGARSNER